MNGPTETEVGEIEHAGNLHRVTEELNICGAIPKPGCGGKQGFAAGHLPFFPNSVCIEPVA
jgi:hypothetical protein